jgi:hypothetical protein
VLFVWWNYGATTPAGAHDDVMYSTSFTQGYPKYSEIATNHNIYNKVWQDNVHAHQKNHIVRPKRKKWLWNIR